MESIYNVVVPTRDNPVPYTHQTCPTCLIRVSGHPEIQLMGVILDHTMYVFPRRHTFLMRNTSIDSDSFEFPVEAEITGPSRTKELTLQPGYSHRSCSVWNRPWYQVETVVDSYEETFHKDRWWYDRTINSTDRVSQWNVLPFVYVPIALTVGGKTWNLEIRCDFPFDQCTLDDDSNLCTHFLGQEAKISLNAIDWNRNDKVFRTFVKTLSDADQDRLWDVFLRWYQAKHKEASEQGLKSALTKNAANFERMRAESPLDFLFFQSLQSKRTRGGISANQLLAEFLRHSNNEYDTILAGLRTCRKEAASVSYDYSYTSTETEEWLHAVSKTLPGAAERIRATEAKKDFRKEKTLTEQAVGLGVSSDRYPKLFKAITGGHIPIGIFHQPGSDQAVNREFPLWEKALAQKGWAETIYEIAANAASRNTYERDITPYLNALFTWPAFVTKHAKGKKWRAMPKFVQSQWELEMTNEGDDDAEGPQKTRKERSAFTPQVDNENRILTIPYVAVTVSGVRTQWCYSRHYHVFQEGFTDPESGGIVLHDLERNLNGQGDDYGLCYFTLTGTVTARGYPTFLIIFERRDSGETWVHFHRVRPCRMSGGVYTPACELVERCYQYMAGNIPASEVTAQQGDLIFIRHPHDPIAAKAKVADDPETGEAFEFESHRFVASEASKVTLYRSIVTQPKNRLGFLHAPEGFEVHHPEHDDLKGLEPGWYEIRRCKSYENNPTGIWSLVID